MLAQIYCCNVLDMQNIISLPDIHLELTIQTQGMFSFFH